MNFFRIFRRKKYCFAALAIVLLIASSLLFLLHVRFHTSNLIAFYGIERNDVLEIQKIIKSEGEKLNARYNFLTLDSSKNLSLQKYIAKNAKLIFVPSGFALETAVNEISCGGTDASLAQKLTPSMKKAVVYNDSQKKIKALPVLADFIQIEYDGELLSKANVSSISSWKDVESFASSQKKSLKNPISFAAHDNAFLLDLLGAIASSIDGKDSYVRACEILKKYGQSEVIDAAKLVAELTENATCPLFSSCRFLKKWLSEKYVAKNLFGITFEKEKELLEQKEVSLIISTLKNRKKMDSKLTGTFSSIYLPSQFTAEKTCFTAPLIYAVPLKNDSKISRLMEAFVSDKNQEILVSATGFAPVTKDAKVSDLAADDVRYWLSQTSCPNAGLSREIYLSEENLEKISVEIKKYINGK